MNTNLISGTLNEILMGLKLSARVVPSYAIEGKLLELRAGGGGGCPLLRE